MCLAKSIEEIYVYLLKQSMPRQGTETIFLDIFIPVLRETINTPLGDGNLYFYLVNILYYRNNQYPARGRKLPKAKQIIIFIPKQSIPR